MKIQAAHDVKSAYETVVYTRYPPILSKSQLDKMNSLFSPKKETKTPTPETSTQPSRFVNPSTPKQVNIEIISLLLKYLCFQHITKYNTSNQILVRRSVQRG